MVEDIVEIYTHFESRSLAESEILAETEITPHVPGQNREVSLPDIRIVENVSACGGRVNAAGLKNRSPLTPAYGSPTTRGRKFGPLKSPTASTKPLAILPGKTGPQLLQIQNGVKPVPLLANMFHDI